MYVFELVYVCACICVLRDICIFIVCIADSFLEVVVISEIVLNLGNLNFLVKLTFLIELIDKLVFGTCIA